VKRILHAYKSDARAWERVGEWIDRIGWPRFFEMTELPFTRYHIDDWRGGRSSLNASSHVHF
jgi:sulfite reductase beta subunit